MVGLFLKLTVGHYRKHRLEALLCLAGVALGVAVVVGIEAAVAACVGSFRGAVESLAERSTHSIFSEQGAISDDTYIQLARRQLPYPLAPVIDRRVLMESSAGPEPDRPVLARLIGVDVFSERALRSYTRMQSSLDESAFRDFLTRPDEVVLADALARRLGAVPGATLEMTVGGERRTVHVAGVVKPSGVARSQLTDLVIADLATAQELTGSVGSIDRIDTLLQNPGDEAALAADLPAGLVLRSTRQQSASLADLVQSYRLNLNALSLMASFVAVFIVYNSMLISVRQRAASLGILRCLGGSRPQLAGIYLLEAIAFALVGGVVGVLGGWGLSRLLVGSIATTINDLYAAVRPQPVTLDAAAFARGMAVSVGSCLVGALVPLVQASRTAPINAFRGSAAGRASHAASNRLAAGGAALLLISYAMNWLPTSSPVVGFVMALTVALGFALLCPLLTRLIAAAVDRAARPAQWLPVQMAAGGVARSLGITGIAVAAMMLAMSMNVGVRTMVRSFRTSLAGWFDRRFAADVFVAPELLVMHKVDATLDPRVLDWVRARPQTRQVIPLRTRETVVGGKSATIVATDVEAEVGTMQKKSQLAGAAYDPAADALVSEPLAGRLGLRVGQTLALDSPTGPHAFRVFAVYFDFGSERGQVMLDRAVYAQYWKDDRVTSLHVRLVRGADRGAVARSWSESLRRDFPVEVNSFDGVKTEVMTVFDRTFKVTSVLTWMAGGVAFCGLAGSLLALALARRKDYGILAAIGMSGRQTTGWVLAQAVLIAWTSAAVACAAGTLLAFVLAYVIQYRSFGWSIPTRAQPVFWLENFILATAAAVIASVYPVWRLRTSAPAGSLREEG